MNPDDCILFSGAAKGAEAAFGAAAEKHGIEEINFTFDGHKDERTRGIRVLTQDEMRQGDVSLNYVGRLMSRSYPDTPGFRRVLQCIWHQINNGQDVFIVGQVLDDADMVLGVVVDGQAIAYPNAVVAYPNVVNDVVGGVRLLVTY